MHLATIRHSPFSVGRACGSVDFAGNFASILLGGISAGTVLFIVSVGLSVTMGLIFIFMAAITIVVGPESQPIMLPPELRGQLNLGFTQYRTYSVFLIVVGFLIVAGVWLAFERTH